MEDEQLKLFPEEKNKSYGLSIVPYLADRDMGKKKHSKGTSQKVERLQKVQTPKMMQANQLTDMQRYYVENGDKFERQKLEREFEDRNGFPLSWAIYETHAKLYRQYGDVSYKLEVSPYSLILKKSVFRPPVRKCYGGRNNITDYSMKSRKRFFEKLLTIDWAEIPKENIKELTLTYPSIFPKDGLILKSHLDSFAKRLKRYAKDYGGIAFAWKLEFQKRGAPHFHLIVVTSKPLPLQEFRTWALETWGNLVGKWIFGLKEYTEEEKEKAHQNHLKAGIEADIIQKSKQGLICYLAWYISKTQGKAKEYQNECPDEYKNVGRWWGIYGKSTGLLHIKKKIYQLDVDGYEAWKRKIMAIWEARGKHYNVSEYKLSLYALNNKESIGEKDC